MTLPILKVDLDLPAERRWDVLAPHVDAVRAMLDAYRDDFGDPTPFYPLIGTYVELFCSPELRAEFAAVAALADRDVLEVAFANLYYDAMKHFMGGSLGCTAFAVDVDGAVLHARNLDWHSPDNVLERHTAIVEYVRGDRLSYGVVGWPGFLGAYSGVAPGRFAVTLNAVLSDEAPGLHPPMTFLLRRALDEAADFDAAVSLLSETAVASDSLLLVSGRRAGDRVIIERTPTRHAIRPAGVVTNDYRTLFDGAAKGVLGATACERFDKASDGLVAVRTPTDAFDVLRKVRMGITV
ncbi:MAG: C45 family autoproteolytic acyltransferase/hydrolase, partial [Myxococcota bacterium]